MNKKDAERLFDAIGELGDEIVAEAERPIKRSFNFGRLAAIAACLIVTVTAVMLVGQRSGDFVGGDSNATPPMDAGSSENEAPDGGVGNLPGEPGESDNESTSRPNYSYTADGVTVTVLASLQNEVRLRITITKEDAVGGIGFVAEHDGKRYVIGYGIEGVSVGRLKIAADGYEAADRLPEGVGVYEVWVMIGEISDGFENLDFTLYIDPIGKIG